MTLCGMPNDLDIDARRFALNGLEAHRAVAKIVDVGLLHKNAQMSETDTDFQALVRPASAGGPIVRMPKKEIEHGYHMPHH